METSSTSFWTSYSNIILLIIGITIGSIVGIVMPDYVHYLKPLGDIFLNLLFVTVIPLVFFAIVTSVASIEQKGKLGKILFAMGITFLCFIVLAALFTLVAVYLFPTERPNVNIASQIHEMGGDNDSWGDRMVKFFRSPRPWRSSGTR